MYLIEKITKFTGAFAFSTFVACGPDSLVAWQDHFLRCVLIGFTRYTPLFLPPYQSLNDQNVRCRDLPWTFWRSCQHHLKVRHASYLHQPCLDKWMRFCKDDGVFLRMDFRRSASEVEVPSNFREKSRSSKASLFVWSSSNLN